MKKPVSVRSFFRLLQNPDVDLPPVSRFVVSQGQDEEEEAEGESPLN